MTTPPELPYVFFHILTPMNLFAIIAIGLLLWKIYCMAYNKLPGDVIGMCIIAIALITGTVPTDTVLSCFSNSSVILVGVLCIISAALIHSGVMHWMLRHLLGTPDHKSLAVIKLMTPVAIMSAIINNIAVVFLFVNIVKVWARRLKMAPSKFLLPLSYAATIGGTCTLMGNVHNLIVAEFYFTETGESMSLLAPLPIGILCTVISILSLYFIQRLIPVRKSPEESFESSADYIVELLVPTDNPNIGMTIAEAGMYSVNGGQLVEIVRFDREIISPVPKDEFILGGDHLVYSGKIDAILELRQSHGLVNATHHVFSTSEISSNRKLQMASVDASSPMIGCSMLDLDFEDTHNVVLIAVAREGERLTGIPREITLRAGDTLLLEGNKLSADELAGNLNFFDSISLPQTGKKTLLSTLIVLGMIILSVFEVVPLLNSCIIAAIMMLITQCLSVTQLQNSINWKVLMVFAGSVCLGYALDATGVARFIADTIHHISDNDVWLSLVTICVAASIMTQFMSNNTVAALMTPVATRVAMSFSANPMTFAIALLMSISCSFATPISSEPNTLIYGPGGYKFTDYIKPGLLLNIILLIIILIFTPIIYPLY